MSELLANRYELLERIGAGGMAEVFRARMVGPAGFQKVVALKRILEDLCADQDFLHRFTDEARLTARLQHPNICQVLDFGAIEKRYFITMEYIEGLDLSKVLVSLERRGELLPPELCLTITSGVLRGLSHAHQAVDDQGRRLGLVHRDVSPQNVLLSINGDIKLSDFGVAKADALVRQARTQENVALGKLAYMAPEQRRGGRVDERTDVFGAGILLAEMLQGPASMRRCAGALGTDRDRLVATAIGRFPGDLAPRVGAVIARATDPRPERRYSDAISMLGEVEQCASELGVSGASDRLGNLVRLLRDEGRASSGKADAPPPMQVRTRELGAAVHASAAASMPGADGAGAEDLETQVKRRGRDIDLLATEVRRGGPAESASIDELQTRVLPGRGTSLEELKTQVRQGATRPFDIRNAADGLAEHDGAASTPATGSASVTGTSDLLDAGGASTVGPSPHGMLPVHPGHATGASDLLWSGNDAAPRASNGVPGSAGQEYVGPAPPRPASAPVMPARETPQAGGLWSSPVQEPARAPRSDEAFPARAGQANTEGNAAVVATSPPIPGATARPAAMEAAETTAVIRHRRQRAQRQRTVFWGAAGAVALTVVAVAIGIGWHFGWRGGAALSPETAGLIGTSPAGAADGGTDRVVEDGPPQEQPDGSAGDTVASPPERSEEGGEVQGGGERRRPPPRERPPDDDDARPTGDEPPDTSALPTRPRGTAPPAQPHTPGVGGRGAARVSIYADPPGVPYIDGRLIGPRTPVRAVEVTAGRHEVRVYFPSTRQEARRVVTLRPGANEVVWLRGRQ